MADIKAAEPAAPRKYLTVRQAAFIGVGGMAGAGIFALLRAAGTVIGLSLLAPAVVGIDKFIQLSRQRKTAIHSSPAPAPSQVRLAAATGQPGMPMSRTEA
jgi:hypothetical protein